MTDRVMKSLRVSWRSLLFPACLTGLVLGLGGFGLWSYHRVSERLATLEQARPISVNVRHLSAKLLEAHGPDADVSVVIGEILQQVQRELEALAEAGFVVIAAEAALSGVPDATTRLYQKLQAQAQAGTSP